MFVMSLKNTIFVVLLEMAIHIKCITNNKNFKKCLKTRKIEQ
jgi:hypothetical protein